MVLLSIDEAILIPADCLLVLRIAPAHLRGGYSGAHALVNFGSALGPLLTGVPLAAHESASMFLTLGAVSLLSLSFYPWEGWSAATAREDRANGSESAKDGVTLASVSSKSLDPDDAVP